MPQPRSTGESGAEFEPLDLLYWWLNGGRTPLPILKGFAELFLKGEFGTLNSRQQEVMEKISRLADEAINSWDEFADFFHLNSPDRQSISPVEIGLEKFALLQEKIISPAIAILQKIRDNTDILLQEKYGTITNEQRELLDALRQNCVFAIQGWHKPVDYFNKQ
jgi:hypothetical protein